MNKLGTVWLKVTTEYGTLRIRCEDAEVQKVMERITGRRTLDTRQIEALQSLGVVFKSGVARSLLHAVKVTS